MSKPTIVWKQAPPSWRGVYINGRFNEAPHIGLFGIFSSEDKFRLVGGFIPDKDEKTHLFDTIEQAKAKASEYITGSALIFIERERQKMVEGYQDHHDDGFNDGGELALAASSYLDEVNHPDDCPGNRKPLSNDDWPWAEEHFKPSTDPIRNLVKAGALIAAEIDRLQRLENRKP